MAPSEVNGAVSTPTELLDEFNKPPEGVVLPPKDIRTIIEKTAGFVARNGPVFEDRVREKERSNPKFSFLNPNDAYAGFYQWRLSEIKAGRGTAVSSGRAGEPAAALEPEKPKGPAEPPEFHFSARMPNINALDLEVVNLTALFVAKRGKSFMTALSQRETRNFQFDFLRPQHSLYQFFTRLVDQYTALLQGDAIEGPNSESNRLDELQKNVKNKYHIIDRAKQRAEWIKFQEQQKQKKEEEEEQEKISYAQIDWHDFVVVETVLFTEADDQAELPPPTSLNDLQSASLEQKAMMSLAPANRRIEEAMPTDEEAPTYYNAYPQPSHGPIPQPAYTPTIPTPVSQPQRPPSAAIPMDYTMPQAEPASPFAVPSPTTLSATPIPPIHTPAFSEEDERIRERTEARERAAASRSAPSPVPGQPPMRIRSDYVPRAQAKRLTSTTAQTTLCPNCRQQIPVSEIEHHMRVELLDPRWKEQRAKAEARAAPSTVTSADVFNNMKRLASQRTDVFDQVMGAEQGGGSGAADGTSGFDPEEEARRKRVATAGMGVGMPPGPAPPMVGIPGYDGSQQGGGAPGGLPHPPPPPMGAVDIEEQIRQIHQKFKQ
ncbi:hypothetical protein AJ80_01669 [Polytolypa hystricis UAMH7299]|uniref:SURP motif domain-containing protein n=1 Tax=Polytolypa hystricis (strain UAMH7299) TaxID=1447883 RepID=A0A2B7Z0G9_POLH7|nr:hypothetical protein AJ80_01669 [Polytolypa hystricis UAMH7299]